ncbi:XRE family transcriptional regulator [Actinomadura sp. GC306]|uniref:helix-turn-helix domain-containing protein n=1 Tax=Actinomadura sp. GC306 TaxID=2530367 RepID=UPI0010502399|nr:helix-turn-helix transcriptional regulator [Actinomadura sp. GC306]TDC70886.1 XRE family transcriptional regulator [Actinomadura sp. GC306]
MTSDDRLSYRRRKIGQALRRYREERNLTQDAAARLVERSPASLSAYENGHRAVRPRDLRQILDHYGVTDDRERKRLLDLAAQGRKKGWWRDFMSYEDPFIVDFASLEAEASRARSFEAVAVPGLLQTEAYTRAVFAAYEPVRVRPRDQNAIAFRMARQRILEVPSFQAAWIIGESALRLKVGGREVMRAQCRRLIQVTEQGHLDLRVVPDSAGAHPGMSGSFTILDVGAEDPMKVVAVDSLTRSWLIDELPSVEYYERVYAELRSLALPKSQSRALIETVASEL